MSGAAIGTVAGFVVEFTPKVGWSRLQFESEWREWDYGRSGQGAWSG